MIRQAPETELRVIGTLIAIGSYKDIKAQKALIQLHKDCFYKPIHRELFMLIVTAFKAQSNFDAINMLDMLRNSSSETFDYFQKSISEKYFSFSSLTMDVEELVSCHEIRTQVTLMQRTLTELTHEPVTAKAKDIVKASLNAIAATKNSTLTDGLTCEDIAVKWLRGDFRGDITVSTGINVLDNALYGGFVNKSLVIIAAGAGVGKTNFALYLLYHLNNQFWEKQSLFFSLEMQSEKIWQRLNAIAAGKAFDKVTDDEIPLLAEKLERIRIYDNTMVDIDYIETTMRLKAMEQPLSVVVVDYIGLVECKGDYERNDLRQTAITNRLTALAIELNCIVIGLSQINRKSADRAKEDRCPYASDAADSSGAHRSCSYWIGVDRPRLHGDENDYFVVKCRKNRHGDIFDIGFLFNGGVFAQTNQSVYKDMLLPAPKVPRIKPFGRPYNDD